jgi:hypothetical protein
MNRSRKRRINSENELLEGTGEGLAAATGSRGRVNFMEEVNYKM